MVLLHTAGFDHYATADIPKKHYCNAVGGYATIVTSPARYAGSQCLSIGNYTARLQIPISIDSDTIVFGLAFYISDAPSSTASLNYSIWLLADNSNQQLAVVFRNDLSIGVYRGTYESGTLLGESAASAFSLETWHYLEFKATIDNTNGAFELRLDGESLISDSSIDTQAQSDNSVAQLALCGVGLNPITIYYDDIYILDDSGSINNDFLGPCRIETLYPSGAGTTTQFTASAGSNYECVDDDADINEDTDYVSTDVVDNVDAYAFDDLTANGGYIHGVVANLALRKTDATARKARAYTYINASSYSGESIGAGDNYSVFQNIWETNPDDSAAWEEADVNGAEFGIKLVG